MRIEHLTIRNFKKFEEATFEFPRLAPAAKTQKSQGSFHLFVGENGSGKSSVLDALAVALGIWHVARPTAGWRAIRPNEARLVARKAGDTIRFEALPSPAIEARGLIGESDVTWTRVNKGNSSKTSNADAKEALSEVESLLQKSRKEENITLPVLAYYGAGRAWLPARDRSSKFELKLGKVSRFDAYYYCLEGRIRDKEINQWFLFEMLEAAQRGKKRNGMQAVEKAVMNCVPGANSLRFDADRKELVIKFGTVETPYYNLSDGQRSVLSLVADIAMKTAILNPHLGKDCAKLSPGVVLIDELDLHLHPKWQRRIVDNLKLSFPNIQFFCTTHSPFVIQSIQQGELIALGDQQDVVEYSGESIEDIAEGVQGVEMPQRSRRSQELGKAAEEYFRLLKSGDRTSKAALTNAESVYRLAAEPFSQEPGLSALLKLEALAADQENRASSR